MRARMRARIRARIYARMRARIRAGMRARMRAGIHARMRAGSYARMRARSYARNAWCVPAALVPRWRLQLCAGGAQRLRRPRLTAGDRAPRSAPRPPS